LSLGFILQKGNIIV